MTFLTDDDNIDQNKDKKIHISKRIGNDRYGSSKDGSHWVIRNYYTGKKKKDKKKLSPNREQVGNDVYEYKYGHIIFTKDFYAFYKKKIDIKKTKVFLRKFSKRVAKATILLHIILIAFIVSTSLFNLASIRISFFTEEENKEVRVGYPINFQWDISSTPSQAFIIWGDGNTLDISKNRSGSLEHAYGLQGRYSPTILVWDFLGQLHTKSIEVEIKNEVLQFNIESEDVVFEGQEVPISVNNIYLANEDLDKTKEELKFIFDVAETQKISNESSIAYSWKNAGTFPITVSVIDSQGIMNSIQKYNNFKRKLSEINEAIIDGSQKLKLFQKAMLYGPDIISELDNFIPEQLESNIKDNSKDILLTGYSIFIGDYLNDLIEEGGGNIVFFDTWVGFNYYYQIIDEKILNASKDSIDLLTHRFEKNIYGDHSVPNFLERKVSHIENFSINYEKKTGKKIGVINHIIKFCDHMSIMSSHLKNQLKEKGIYVLNLERDYSRANRGQLSTRIEAFLEMM